MVRAHPVGSRPDDIVEPATERWTTADEAAAGIRYDHFNVKASEAPDPPDGPDAVIAPFDVWELDGNGQAVRCLHQHTPDPLTYLVRAAQTRTGPIAVAASWGSLRVFDLRTFRQQRRLLGHSAPVWTVDVIEELGLVVSGSEDSSVRVWGLPTGQTVAAFTGETPLEEVRATVVDGRVTVIAGEVSGRVHVLKLRQESASEPQ